MVKHTTCQPASVVNPANPINPNDKSPCYSNYNFSIFRVLLPVIDGFADDPANRAAKLAAAYIRIVERNVFEPVGAQGVDAKPPATGPQASGYAFSYKYPGTTSGYDWGDDSLGVGAAGWYLAIDDIAKVLYSLNKNDGRILTSAQLQDMLTPPLGWDTKTDPAGYRWVEKNGGWSMNGTTISTSIALFGPGVFGALFMNSDVLGPGLQNNWQWCNKCQALAFAGNANLGDCPAGGLHNHTGSGNYCLAMGGTVPPPRCSCRDGMGTIAGFNSSRSQASSSDHLHRADWATTTPPTRRAPAGDRLQRPSRPAARAPSGTRSGRWARHPVSPAAARAARARAAPCIILLVAGGTSVGSMVGDR